MPNNGKMAMDGKVKCSCDGVWLRLRRFGNHEKRTLPVHSDDDPTFDAVFAFPWLPSDYSTFVSDGEAVSTELTVLLIDRRSMRDDRPLGKVRPAALLWVVRARADLLFSANRCRS
jgi:hypothetical protein